MTRTLEQKIKRKIYRAIPEIAAKYSKCCKEQYLKNKIHRLAIMKIYRNNSENRKKMMEKVKLWRLSHPEYDKICHSSTKGKEQNKKHNAKRRKELGYNLLNQLFEDCDSHHLDKINVINIPKILHKAIYHEPSNNEQMKQINITT